MANLVSDTGLAYINPPAGDVRPAPHAKLTAKQVREIKRMILDKVPDKRIAAIYGIGGGTVWHIKKGHTWKRVRV